MRKKENSKRKKSWKASTCIIVWIPDDDDVGTWICGGLFNHSYRPLCRAACLYTSKDTIGPLEDIFDAALKNIK